MKNYVNHKKMMKEHNLCSFNVCKGQSKINNQKIYSFYKRRALKTKSCIDNTTVATHIIKKI